MLFVPQFCGNKNLALTADYTLDNQMHQSQRIRPRVTFTSSKQMQGEQPSRRESPVGACEIEAASSQAGGSSGDEGDA